jgi:hypothetical protein
MATLHIEHPISDFGVWSEAFARFADARERAGVRRHRVSRPVDDDHYVIIDLEFDDIEPAEQFRSFLRTRVWSTSESSPALAGEPRTLVFAGFDAHPDLSAGPPPP